MDSSFVLFLGGYMIIKYLEPGLVEVSTPLPAARQRHTAHRLGLGSRALSPKPYTLKP